MTGSIQMNEKEQVTAIVFGDTFSLYDEKSFDEFVAPFYIRLKNNGVNTDLFKGKRCLDAGCGGGRGSILMAQCGAKEVIGVDFSATNIESCRKRAQQKGFTNLTFHQHSLMELPFEDESFDIVWCNGVLMHTIDPDAGLKEIARVLKKGGHMWLYVYGSGGIYWYMVDWVRNTLKDVDVKDCIYQLRIMEMPIRRIAEWIDDWFAGYLRRYTHADVETRLNELGFIDTGRLKFGTIYDTSQRKQNADMREIHLMGEGDLRYFCQKLQNPGGDKFRLPDSPQCEGSCFVDSPEVTQFAVPLGQLSENLKKLEKKKGHEISTLKILVCKSVHTKVRTLLETEGPFDTDELMQHLENLNSLVASAAT
jgi:ubiquinone/menaquinone biosynthesis C-methylase UbiE